MVVVKEAEEPAGESFKRTVQCTPCPTVNCGTHGPSEGWQPCSKHQGDGPITSGYSLCSCFRYLTWRSGWCLSSVQNLRLRTLGGRILILDSIMPRVSMYRYH